MLTKLMLLVLVSSGSVYVSSDRRYSQWRSRFLRYIDTKPNGEGLRKSILSGPYVPSTVLVQAIAATEGVPAVQQHTTIETVLNMTPENTFCLKRKQFSCFELVLEMISIPLLMLVKQRMRC
ncbi:hypothetical protein Tco_0048223 [Tanacetum coccineum]